MSLIAQNDEASRKVVRSGRLMIPYYSPRGQEVIPSAVSVNLNDDDQICTIYRGIHDMLAKGVPLRDLWAEIAGRVTGTCKGKGGPMHITHPASGAILTTGIVGSSMPIANGLAWSYKLDGSRRVAVAYFGDGASNIGAFHESLNLASLWKLPVIFVCQNNRFGEHTRYENATFRFFGHVFGDDDSYMTKEEKSAAMERDPVPAFRARLIADGTATEAQIAEIEAKIASQIEDAIQYALGSDMPPLEELRRDVFAEEVYAKAGAA